MGNGKHDFVSLENARLQRHRLLAANSKDNIQHPKTSAFMEGRPKENYPVYMTYEDTTTKDSSIDYKRV